MQIKEALKEAILQLKQSNINTANLDARLLLQHVANITQETIFLKPELEISSAIVDDYKILIDRRLKNEPIAKIIGKKSFWKADFFVNKHTLDPRPDSEVIIETALKIFPDKNAALKFLDLGVGSGCLILSLLQEFPQSTGIAVDISIEALKVTKQNAASLGLENRIIFLQTNWADGLISSPSIMQIHPPRFLSLTRENSAPLSSMVEVEASLPLPEVVVSSLSSLAKAVRPKRGDIMKDLSQDSQSTFANEKEINQFDLIVSNPPYIPSIDIQNLAVEVKEYDPMIALDGGEDGLNPYRYLAKQIMHLLKPNSCAILEFGYDQGDRVKEIFINNNYNVNEMLFDLSGKQRAIRVSI